MNSVSIITVDFPSDELAEKMSEAQYHTKDFQMISEMIFSEKRQGSYFEHLLTVCEHNGMDREAVREGLEYQMLTDYIL